MSKAFSRYIELMNMAAEKNVTSYALDQYLHIAQVMNKEEESYKKHRKEMYEWLHNIEKSVISDIKESGNHGNDSK